MSSKAGFVTHKLRIILCFRNCHIGLNLLSASLGSVVHVCMDHKLIEGDS